MSRMTLLIAAGSLASFLANPAAYRIAVASMLAFGADSVDGTMWARWSHTYLRRAAAALEDGQDALGVW